MENPEENMHIDVGAQRFKLIRETEDTFF